MSVLLKKISYSIFLCFFISLPSEGKRSSPVYDIEDLAVSSPIIIKAVIGKLDSKNNIDYATVLVVSTLKGELPESHIVIRGWYLNADQPSQKPSPPPNILIGHSYFFFLTGAKENNAYRLINEYDGVIGFSWPVKKELLKYINKIEHNTYEPISRQ